MARFLKTRHPGESRTLLSKSRRDSGFRRNDVRKRRKDEDGFTLVELMVVIVIIGLLATVVVVNVMPAQDTARVKKAEADIATLEQAAELYRLNRLNYPAGLDALVSEGFIKRLPTDPWGNAYRYAAPGRSGAPFDIYSLGADNAEGGEGDDADIGTFAK
ncbi:type II secretion system major pseudopilin GspG [Allosphingosinicella flava]|uniref:Type II secretion system core protein G n=1 Tax=Allosphingosinicella flava TaxID=2771430 RepID=A0A7T2LL52_9SPHN|nr:type II secretion system major pseudopilin GspG [Sphingosinicella flava]QPQ53993.1 type II secretion system major pseudopilin GspG [Sphingosinicella flava]